MAKTNVAQFVREVRQEVAKVVWPSRQETMITTLIVFIFVTIMALFFLMIDSVFSSVIKWIMPGSN